MWHMPFRIALNSSDISFCGHIVAVKFQKFRSLIYIIVTKTQMNIKSISFEGRKHVFSKFLRYM
jgi:hypothetical protein